MPSVPTFAAMLVQTQRAYPELAIERVNFAQASSDVIEIQGQGSAVLVRPRANFVTFDPATGQLIQHQDGRDLSVHHRISE
ncbi:MAG: PepSY-associated TM helix domain-containing protein, partial [Paraglaciecola chathamensis]